MLLKQRNSSVISSSYLDFEIVDKTENRNVPNHLLNTKIFWKLLSNKFIKSHPFEVHFADLFNSKGSSKRRRLLQLTNISSQATRLHILPPDTEFFKIYYKLPRCLVPGLSVNCTVEFLPKEPRFYEDYIRVHTEDQESQLIVPIYAYPTVGNLNFPSIIKLPPTPIGEMISRTISLKSHSSVEFEFLIRVIEKHPSFNLQPLRGTLRAEQVTEIKVEFRPTNYTTSRFMIELNVAQINFQPLVCTIIGLAKTSQDRMKFIESNKFENIKDHLNEDECEKTNLCTDLITNKKLTIQDPKRKSKVSENISPIPKIMCPGELSTFLIGRKTKRMKNLDNGKTRQEKLIAFESLVYQDYIEEQKNQVRWQAKLGSEPLSREQREVILNERELEWKNYYDTCSHPEVMELFPNTIPKAIIQNYSSIKYESVFNEIRPHRPVDLNFTIQTVTPTFKMERLSKTSWLYKRDLLEKFRQIVSRVILIKRMDKRIKKLKSNSKLNNPTNDINYSSSFEKYNQLIGKPLNILDLNNNGTQIFDKSWSERKLNINLTQTNLSINENSKISIPPIVNVINKTSNQINDNSNSNTEQDNPDYYYNSLLSTFKTPKQYWPLFDQISNPTIWEYEGCEKFDFNSAYDLAKLGPCQIDIESLLPIKLIENQSNSENYNLPSSDMRNIAESQLIELPNQINHLPTKEKDLNCYSLNPIYHGMELTSINNSILTEYKNNSIEQLLFMRENYDDTNNKLNSNYLNSLCQLFHQNEVGKVLRDWSSTSIQHQPLVPLPSLPKSNSNIPIDESFIENVLTIENNMLNSNEQIPIEQEVENELEKLITQFPELSSYISKFKNENEETSKSKIYNVDNSNLNNLNKEISSLTQNQSLNSNVCSLESVLDEAFKMENEIYSICDHI